MSKRAWAYIGATILAGAVFGAAALLQLSAQPADWFVFLVLAVLGTLTQQFKAHLYKKEQHSTSGSTNYSPILLFLFAGVILLPPGLYVLLVLVPHLIEWILERSQKSINLTAWYIQPFNIATHLIGGLAAHVAYVTLPTFGLPLPISATAVAGLVGTAIYMGLNHLLIGEALILARGVTWKESGVLDSESLLSDAILLYLGFGFALLWQLNPWFTPTILLPLVLIQRALAVPRLRLEAQLDSKTGLLNYRHFSRALTAEWDRAKRTGTQFTVVMADLDLLRNINNTYGHLAGDAVLAVMGKILCDRLREYDLAGRFGGEEFSLLLPLTGELEAHSIAERLRETIANTPFEVKTSSTPIHVTMSFGISVFPQDGASPNELIHAADLAVYQAKLRGRNCTVHASEIPHSMSVETAAVAVERVESPYTGTLDESAYLPATMPAEARVDVASPVSTSTAAKSPERPLFQKVLFGVYVSAVISLGAILTVAGLAQSRLDWATIGLFAALGVFTELFKLMLSETTSVSVSVAISFAIALIAGIPGVAAVSAATVLTHRIHARGPWDRAAVYKTLFNWALHVLAGAVPALFIKPLGIPSQFGALLLVAIPAVFAAGAYYFVDTFLLAAVIALTTGASVIKTWLEDFRWLAGHFVMLCLLGFILAVAYTALGLLGIIVFAVPVLMMRYVIKQYVERTEKSVREAKRMNEELSAANREILAASLAIRQFNDELLMTLAKIIDARDPFVSGHSGKVSEYAAAIAQELSLPIDRRKVLGHAALLHDIGKLGIPEQLLQKPSRLTAEEYELIKIHTTLGGALLSSSQGLRQIVPFVQHHHERWDGTGYPSRMRGDEIPLEARILAVCDSIEAMASDRPYHRAMPWTAIVAELKRCAGTQFDPRVVDAFVRVAERDSGKLIVNSAYEVLQRHFSQNGGLAAEGLPRILGAPPAIATAPNKS